MMTIAIILCTILGYVETGFLLLQFEVDKAIIKKKSGQSILFDNVIMHVKKMPYPPYVEDPLLTAIQSNLPLFLMLGFILYEIQLTKNIIFEKERKLKVKHLEITYKYFNIIYSQIYFSQSPYHFI